MHLQPTYKNDIFATSKSPENTIILRPLFTGKEKDSETGYYYFGARNYNSDLSLWLSVDPMADKYPNLSPYNYCAWNPMRLVDPDGLRFDTVSMTYVNQLRGEIDKRIETNPNKKEEYEQVLGELTELTESNQLYHIDKIKTINTNGGLSIEGYTEYSLSDNSVQIHFDGTFGALAHELKHAYQFEKGHLSFDGTNNSSPGVLYVFKNERQAYDRGKLFGGTCLSHLWIALIYSRIDMGTDPMRLISAETPIGLGEKTTYRTKLEEKGDIFRNNGQTYRGKNIIVK